MISLLNGDCIEKMRELPENSVDSIVTDPPYELGFMGKSWDSTGIANNPMMWAECLRVLKPGGHLLAFSGTRTYHRMASAIEDAGFEVRDMIEWVYGSGFPKSLNIGKAVDKHGGKSVSWFGKWLREWREKENIPQKEVSRLFPSKTGGLTGCVANWELGLNIPTNEQFNLICKTFNLPFESLEEAERELVGKGLDYGHEEEKEIDQKFGFKAEYNVTKGTSEWEGWGTAFKPAHEPICMARKPLAEKTVAENCLKWGTGGINVDGSRVEGVSEKEKNWTKQKDDIHMGYGGSKSTESREMYNPTGRFPANLIHDNSEEVRECFPETGKSTGGRSFQTTSDKYGEYANNFTKEDPGFGDSGNASRFFKSIIYQAKASKSERNKGCEGLEGTYVAQGNQAKAELARGNTDFNNSNKHNNVQLLKNHHPTVKPIALMEYLIKMVTPEGGTVLDPFMGSGSTGVAAKQNGYSFIGIDMTPEYVEIAKARLDATDKTHT